MLSKAAETYIADKCAELRTQYETRMELYVRARADLDEAVSSLARAHEALDRLIDGPYDSELETVGGGSRSHRDDTALAEVVKLLTEIDLRDAGPHSSESLSVVDSILEQCRDGLKLLDNAIATGALDVED